MENKQWKIVGLLVEQPVVAERMMQQCVLTFTYLLFNSVINSSGSRPVMNGAIQFFTQRVKSGTETSSQGESNAIF